MTLVIVSCSLEVTRPLTKQLQSASFDDGSTREHVTFLYVMLEKMRADIEEHHKSCFVEVVTLAENVGATVDKCITQMLLLGLSHTIIAEVYQLISQI